MVAVYSWIHLGVCWPVDTGWISMYVYKNKTRPSLLACTNALIHKGRNDVTSDRWIPYMDSLQFHGISSQSRFDVEYVFINSDPGISQKAFCHINIC